MLVLLDTPRWQPQGAAPVWVPATLPGAVLVYLAAQPQWFDRMALADVFWPDRDAARQRHQLRVTLHRVRQLLVQWGAPPDALEATDHRVRLSLPTDLGALAAQGVDASASAPGMGLAGFLRAFDVPTAPAFGAWKQARARVDAAASPAPIPARPGDLPPEPVVQGREAETARLRAARLPAIVVPGEPGIGKTALLGHAFPDSPGLQAREMLSGLAYRPIVAALRARGAALGRACRQPGHPLAAYRLDLARVMPELAPREPLPPLDALTAKSRLLDAFSVAFADVPVLRIDDLQWCDEGTLEWLALLAHEGRMPWRATMRLGFADSAAARLVGRLEQAGRAETLQLGAIAPSAARRLCAQAADVSTWSAAVFDTVYRRSAGNPFALQQWVRQVVARGNRPPVDDDDLPAPVVQLVLGRLQALPSAARAWVEAASVLAEPAMPKLLSQVAGTQQLEDLGFGAASLAQQAGLLVWREGGRLDCTHDLVREATLAALAATQRTLYHRRAAQALADDAEHLEPQRIAGHWSSAEEPQAALHWLDEAATRAKAIGDFEQAEALWRRIAAEASDPALRLRAELGLGEARLHDDLPAGRALIQAVLAAATALPDPAQRLALEGRCLASLVDNAVFAGDMPQAGEYARRLESVVAQLAVEDRLHALEVLVEYTMRLPDLARADACVRQMELLAPDHAMTRSLRAQWHWVSGDIRAARDGFEQLLVTHAAWARGHTLENDLGVMLHALGDLGRAELMLRRSLESWRGMKHTETLSNLALGAVFTSAGRFDEAAQRLELALALARAQGSMLFTCEALTRLARLHWLQQVPQHASARLDEAAPLVLRVASPLPLSQYLATLCVVDQALGQAPSGAVVGRLGALAQAAPHPLVRARWARGRLARHAALRDVAQALAAAREQADTAQQAGLAEWQVEALLWIARLAGGDEAATALQQARALAQAHGLVAWWPALQQPAAAP